MSRPCASESNRLPDPEGLVALNRADFTGAAGVFLLVFLSTFPVVVPFFLVDEESEPPSGRRTRSQS